MPSFISFACNVLAITAALILHPAGPLWRKSLLSKIVIRIFIPSLFAYCMASFAKKLPDGPPPIIAICELSLKRKLLAVIFMFIRQNNNAYRVR